MKKIAVLAYFFPPVSQVGYKRPLRFADHLRKSGYAPVVYAVHPGTPQLWNYSGVDPALLKQVDPGIAVVRTPSVHLFKILLAWRDRAATRGSSPAPAAVAAPASATKGTLSASVRGSLAPEAARASLPRRLVDGFMGLFEVPDPYWGWIFTTLPALLLRSLLARPRAIYVTGPPWSPLVLATLAGKILRVPVHLDYRDPWNTNTYWKAKKVSLLLERWVMRSAASVIANTDSMAESFLKVHPYLAGRLHTVYNGYEATTRARMEGLRERFKDRPRDRFTVSHIGMLYPNRMPRSLARLLAEVAAGWKGDVPLRLRFVGNVMDKSGLLEEFGARGVSDVLEFTGEVATAAAQEEEAKADVLMLLQSGTKEQIPAKVFEYVFTGNPILCVADADSETASLVRKYGLGQVLGGGEGAAEWLDFLASVRDLKGGGEVSPDFLRDFDGETLSERIRAIVLPGSSGLP